MDRGTIGTIAGLVPADVRTCATRRRAPPGADTPARGCSTGSARWSSRCTAQIREYRRERCRTLMPRRAFRSVRLSPKSGSGAEYRRAWALALSDTDSPPANTRVTVAPRPIRRLPWLPLFAEAASKFVSASIDVRPSSATTTRGVAVTRHPSRSCRASCFRYSAFTLRLKSVEPVNRRRILAHGPTLWLYPSPPVQRRPRRTPADTLPLSNRRASPMSPDAVTSFHREFR